jgi:magnesium-protoporphyrin O-methyltransferase
MLRNAVVFLCFRSSVLGLHVSDSEVQPKSSEPLAELLLALNSVPASSKPGWHAKSVHPRVAPVVAQARVDDKAEVEEYFNNEGFNRWNKIYSASSDVNPVQKIIRRGHATTIDKVLRWIDADIFTNDPLKGETICDAGCGVGSLSLPLAERGGIVTGTDISAAMVEEARRRAKRVDLEDSTKFEVCDLEKLEGEYDTVTCIDVLIHYPQDKMEEMVQKLAKCAKNRLILSFAPKTWYYTGLKAVGDLAPGASKATRAYLHSDEAVCAAIERTGLKITRTEMTGDTFYFSRLIEATRGLEAQKRDERQIAVLAERRKVQQEQAKARMVAREAKKKEQEREREKEAAKERGFGEKQERKGNDDDDDIDLTDAPF